MTRLLDSTLEQLLGILDALEIGRVLNRPDLKLISAQVACEKWDEEERRLAKERKR